VVESLGQPVAVVIRPQAHRKCGRWSVQLGAVDAAAHAGRDPDRVSFVAALRIARRSVAQGSFSPSAPNHAK
jgi:hypothetical protein